MWGATHNRNDVLTGGQTNKRRDREEAQRRHTWCPFARAHALADTTSPTRDTKHTTHTTHTSLYSSLEATTSPTCAHDAHGAHDAHDAHKFVLFLGGNELLVVLQAHADRGDHLNVA